MAADSESGAEPPASLAAPASVTVSRELRAQRGDQLGDVERVPRGPAGEPHQVVVGPAAGQGRYQVGHRRAGEPGELEPARRSPAARRSASRSSRCGTGRIIPTSSSGTCCATLRQPGPQGDAGLIGPLQVVHDQDGGPHRALLGDERQQLLRQHRLARPCPGRRRPRRAAARRSCSAAGWPTARVLASRPGTAAAAAPGPARRRCPRTPGSRPSRLGDGRLYQRGLADARLTLDEHRTALSPGDLLYEPGKQRHLAFAAD